MMQGPFMIHIQINVDHFHALRGYMLNNKSECINAPAQSHHVDGLCCQSQMASIFLLYDEPYKTNVL